jgi:FAD/FMN-containing dehydrogenase
VRVAARSGGHSYGGYSVCRGLVVDVTETPAVHLGTRGTTATVGAGARLIDVYTALGSRCRLLHPDAFLHFAQSIPTRLT